MADSPYPKHAVRPLVGRFLATYWLETPLALKQAAALIAGEQSSGTFVSVPGETEELKNRFAARVESVRQEAIVRCPSLPGCCVQENRRPTRFHTGTVTISWPEENVGHNLAALISTVQGNLYEIAQVSGVKLLDLTLPDSMLQEFPGPKFGVIGSRKAVQVEDRPLIGTIIKPSVGLTPDVTAELVRTLIEAGVDFVKDDELMANPPHSPFEVRCQAIMRVVNEVADKTGRKIMYAANISDEWDAMRRHYDTLVSLGGTCAMLSINAVGPIAAKAICDFGQLVIHGHRNGFGMLHRHPALGIDFVAYQKLARLIGVDQLHVNGIDNKFWEPDDSVVRSIQACLAEQSGQRLLPVVSSGQWGGQAFETYRRTQTVDLLYMAGGGIMAHPRGPAQGVRAIQDAWSLAVAGYSLDQAAKKSQPLAEAIAKFGK
ncbi:MAG: ribulose-bisphosphate carboxylase large subunit family protein [Planctomycetales bacterium]|nr:ribulose-bisphosphate carboxylase large subunit family protein [Planctomycetales bacterium]